MWDVFKTQKCTKKKVIALSVEIMELSWGFGAWVTFLLVNEFAS